MVCRGARISICLTSKITLPITSSITPPITLFTSITPPITPSITPPDYPLHLDYPQNTYFGENANASHFDNSDVHGF